MLEGGVYRSLEILASICFVGLSLPSCNLREMISIVFKGPTSRWQNIRCSARLGAKAEPTVLRVTHLVRIFGHRHTFRDREAR